LVSDFELYRELMERLGVSSNVPAALFFHGSASPPEQIFSEGIDIQNRADRNAFAGHRFYGSVASKAAMYARPYLYLYMLVWPDAHGRPRSLFSPRNQREARSSEADVLLIGQHTETPNVGQGGKYFKYPELAIRNVSREAGVIPLACFEMDCPMLAHYPAMDAQRRVRVLWPDANHDSFMEFVRRQAEDENAPVRALHNAESKKQHMPNQEDADGGRRVRPYTTSSSADGYFGYSGN
jgi:hypothetical protein